MNIGDKFDFDGQEWQIVALLPNRDRVDAMNQRGQHRTFSKSQATTFKLAK